MMNTAWQSNVNAEIAFYIHLDYPMLDRVVVVVCIAILYCQHDK